MLISETLFGLRDKVQEAIDLLKKHEPPEGYYLAFSGGKDSVCIYRLAEMAGVKFDAHYQVGVDMPELVSFIKKKYPQVTRHLPKKTMWGIIKRRGPVTRIYRDCCRILKETGGKGRLVVTGIRAEESPSRSKLGQFSYHNRSKKKMIHPIFYWEENEVWDFIETNNLSYCSLYDDPGLSRLGCVMCPMGSKEKRRSEAKRYPKYYLAYIRAFQRWIENGKMNPMKERFKTGQEVMDWWLSQ